MSSSPHTPKAAPSPNTTSPRSSLSPQPSASSSSKTKVQIHDPEEDVAARKIQDFLRTHIPRHKALKAISAIASEFESMVACFTFPETLDFAETASDSPKLLFTHHNGPVLGHEEALMKLLSKLDAVESYGDASIRMERKNLVKRIEKRLDDVDTK
ncbi:hypothetical protein M422DRAFT_164179, partial [Sphaerobolus stellatus SS14]